MFMSLSLKENNQDVINQAIRELQRVVGGDVPSLGSVIQVGDTNYSIATTDLIINQNVSNSTTRTWTLPASSSVNPGHTIKFVGVGGVNPLVLQTAGGTDALYFTNDRTTATSVTFDGFHGPISFTATLIIGGAPGSPQFFWAIDYSGTPQWIAWTPAPTWAGGSGTASLSGSGRYVQYGKTVFWTLAATVGASGTTTPYIDFTPPPPSLFGGIIGAGAGRETNVNGKGVIAQIAGVNSTINLADASTILNGMSLQVTGVYETT